MLGTGDLIKQCFCLLQNRRIEAFGEPDIDRRQQVAGLATLTLIDPKASEADGGTQFKGFCTLPLGDSERLMILLLGCSLVTSGIEQLAAQAMQLGLNESFVRPLDDLCRLGEAIESLGRLPELEMNFGQHDQ
jgi:hypothetical protein